jgi:diguanylate cyclase (GGDEF)-like protein
METFTHLLRHAQRRAEMVTLVYMDVDDFKLINDSRGHLHGDAVLRTLADVLRTISRLEDATFRFGGDEFCVLLPDCNEEQARKVYISRLQEELQRTLPGISLSIGCVQTGPEAYHDAEELIRLADEHMYRQKRSQAADDIA